MGCRWFQLFYFLTRIIPEVTLTNFIEKTPLHPPTNMTSNNRRVSLRDKKAERGVQIKAYIK
jgi:hypothetical protein